MHTTDRREPFVMIPRALLYSGLPLLAQHAWCVLDDLAREDPGVHVTQQALARTLHRGRSQTKEALAALADAGFVAVVADAGKANVYVPLRRPRPVHRAVDNPVHDRGVPSRKTDHLLAGKPATLTGVVFTRARGEEEQEAHGSARAPSVAADREGRPLTRRPWCGACDERTRLRYAGDTATRCPVCHPIRTADPVF